MTLIGKLAVTIFAIADLVDLLREARLPQKTPFTWSYYVIGVLGDLSMALAPWFAYPALAIGALALFSTLVRGGGVGSEPTVIIPCLIAVAVKNPRVPLWVVTGCFTAWAVTFGLVVGDAVVTWVYLIMILLSVLAGLGLRHFLVERAAALREIEELKIANQRIRISEREFLARELHDVVSHELSHISMQALAHAESDNTEELRTALLKTHSITKAAFVQLRALVLMLREVDEDGTPINDEETLLEASLDVPQIESTLAEVTASLRDLGFDPHVDIDLGTRELDRPTHTTVTRIIKEAETNIVRHAAPRSGCDFIITATPDKTYVRISSPLNSSAKKKLTWQSSGQGLRGLHERIDLLGGDFTAGSFNNQWIIEAAVPTYPDVPI